MYDYLMTKDSELWDVILDGPYVPTINAKDGNIIRVVPKTRHQYSFTDKRKIEKNHKAKKLWRAWILWPEKLLMLFYVHCGILPTLHTKLSFNHLKIATVTLGSE